MKHVFKKIAASALVLCLVCACLPFCAQAADAIGENVFMRYDADTNTYTIYGSGPSFNFEQGAHSSNETFARIVIEAGVTHLGAHLFDSSMIGELVLPDAPLTISTEAFTDCTINCITFPQTAEDVTQYDFGGEYSQFGDAYVYGLDLGGLNGFPDGFGFCEGDNYDLRELIVGANTTMIPDNCCNCFGELASLTLPDGLLSIGECAFESCEALQTVRIPDSVTTIGDYAFDYCTELQTVTLPKSLLTIGNWAFCTCEDLASVTIPGKTTSIGESAFEDCAALESVHIPASVEEIGDNAFYGCANLAYICCDAEDCCAKTYAKACGIEFRQCDGHGSTERVAGDLDGDSEVTLKDVVILERYLVGGWGVIVDESAADLDGDGEVTLQDVTLLCRYIAGGWDVELV